MAVTDKFVRDLRQFFKEAEAFLLKAVEDYSMGAEDDAETDRLVGVIKKLDTEAASLQAGEEVYDDNVVPQQDEYLAPTEQELKQAKTNAKVGSTSTSQTEEDGLITEDTYEDPYASKDHASSKQDEDQGIMEETYEDPNDQGKDSKKGGTVKVEEDDGIMEDTYEDPYASKEQEKKGAKSKEEGEDEGTMDDLYEDPYADRQVIKPPPASSTKEDTKKGAKKEKKDKKKDKKSADDTVSNRSDESNEGSSLTMTAAQMQDSEIYGPLRKQHGVRRNFLSDKNYWCAIKDGVLHYFEGKAKKHKGQIVVKDYNATEADKKKFVFQLSCPGRKNLFFSAVNEKDMRQWVVYINTGKMPDDSAKADSPRDKVEEDIEIEEGDLYEDEEPPMKPTKAAASKPDEQEDEEGLIMEELYEDPGDYQDHKVQRTEVVQEVGPGEEVYDDTMTPADRPFLPPRDTDARGKNSPPPLPSRDLPSSPGSRPPIDTPAQSEELYDDTATPMVVVDDGEVYDDGTSAPPPPPTTNADILRKKPPARAPSPSPSPPPPPVKFDAMYYGLWPCENVGEHELEFSRGACIEVVNKDRYDSKGWWVGKLGGKVGLVPKDYMFPMYKQI